MDEEEDDRQADHHKHKILNGSKKVMVEEEEEVSPLLGTRCKHDVLTSSTPTALFEPAIPLALGGAAARRASAFGNEQLAPSADDRLSLTIHPAASPQGLVLVRGFCQPDEATTIYSSLDSADAASRPPRFNELLGA